VLKEEKKIPRVIKTPYAIGGSGISRKKKMRVKVKNHEKMLKNINLKIYKKHVQNFFSRRTKTSNHTLQKIATKLEIPHFRGVYSRNALPKTGVKSNECGIINLDDCQSIGTHWVAFVKKRNKVWYFDSFGDLPPPEELIDYFGKRAIVYYNYNKYQEWSEAICGQLAIAFLLERTSRIF